MSGYARKVFSTFDSIPFDNNYPPVYIPCQMNNKAPQGTVNAVGAPAAFIVSHKIVNTKSEEQKRD